jgi:hypothetical protein
MGWSCMGTHELHKDLRYENLMEKKWLEDGMQCTDKGFQVLSAGNILVVVF